VATVGKIAFLDLKKSYQTVSQTECDKQSYLSLTRKQSRVLN
jgi:hypothetical protein